MNKIHIIILYIILISGLSISYGQNTQESFSKEDQIHERASNRTFANFYLDRSNTRDSLMRNAELAKLKEKILQNKKMHPYRGQKANVSDSLALVALYNATDGDNWTNNTNWLIGPVGTWYGVYIGDNNRIVSIYLFDNNLIGSIPPDLDALSGLFTLSLSSNQLTGDIPAELQNLLNLNDLYLGSNQLSGNIPPELGSLSNLQNLSLSENLLNGNIPIEFGDLINLITLNLSKNQLSGNIPITIGNLVNLEVLGLDENQLNGSIPETLGNLTNLSYLNFMINELSGSIPATLGNLINLETLGLTNNQLTGNIPSAIGNLANLQFLSVGINQLTGNIPVEIGNLLNLEYMVIGSNQLTGSIPETIGNLISLQYLSVSHNQLESPLPPTICSGLPNINHLYLGYNLFDSQDCQLINCLTDRGLDGFGHSPQSNGFNFDTNCLTPSQTDSLALVALYNATNGDNWSNNTNWLTGPLEYWYGVTLDENKRVTKLILDNNNLNGYIPSEIGVLNMLQQLRFRSNEISGSIPTEIGSLSELQYLFLSGNQISSSIPSEVGNLTNLQWLQLQNNQISGTIPSELGNTDNIERIEISGNLIIGPIPPDLCASWPNLTHLYLQNNLFDSDDCAMLECFANRNLISYIGIPQLNDIRFDCFSFQLPDTIISCGLDSVILDAGEGFDSYFWTTLDSSQSIAAKINGRYAVQVNIDGLGWLSDTTFVRILSPNLKTTNDTINIGETSQLRTKYSEFEGSSVSNILDYENNSYGSVEVGGENWLTKNISSQCFSNGDSIPMITIDEESQWRSSAAWANYNDDINNDAVYGKIYNWYVIRDPRNICPPGWTIPTDNDWENFANSIGAENAGYHMKSTTGWINNGNGDNSSDFNGLPGGIRNSGPIFDGLGEVGTWWTATPQVSGYNYNVISLLYNSNTLNISMMNSWITHLGYSIRCKDRKLEFLWSTGETTEYIDVSPTQSTTYYVTVTDEFGSCEDSVRIFINNIDVSAIINQNMCAEDESGGIDITVNGGTAPHTFLWSGPDAYTSTDEDISNLLTGTYSLLITDADGLQKDTTFIVLAEDNIDPITICKNITIQLDENNSAIIEPADLDDGSYDNCNFTLAASQLLFDESDIGVNTITLTATDGNGNMTSCNATVTVEQFDPPTIYFNPNLQSVFTSDVFTTTIEITGVENLGGFELELPFNKDILQANSVVLGDFLESSGRTIFPLENTIDNDMGLIEFGIITLGDNPPGPNGDGILLEIEWVATDNLENETTIDLILQDIQCTHLDGSLIPFVNENATVTIIPCFIYDLDCDCDVDIIDVTSVAYHYDTEVGDQYYDANFDFDMDGDIDIVDVAIVAYNYGWTCDQKSFKIVCDFHAEEIPEIKFSDPELVKSVEGVYEQNIYLSSVEDLGGYELTIGYDPIDIVVLEVIKGNILNGSNRKQIEIENRIDQAIGRIEYALTGLGSDKKGAYGDGVLITLRYTINNSTSSVFNILADKTQLVRPNAEIIPFELSTMENISSRSQIISTYPNPLKNQMQIDYQIEESGEVIFHIYNVYGDLLYSSAKQYLEKGIHNESFNGTDLAVGVYVVSMEYKGQIVDSKRIIIN